MGRAEGSPARGTEMMVVNHSPTEVPVPGEEPKSQLGVRGTTASPALGEGTAMATLRHLWPGRIRSRMGRCRDQLGLSHGSRAGMLGPGFER